MIDLSVNIAGLKLKNPIISGAGPLAGTADHIKNLVDAGFGAICTKTTSYAPHLQRYPRPLYALVDYKIKPNDPYFVPEGYTWLHREHNSIFPPEKFAKIIEQVAGYCHTKGVAIIGNIAGRGLAEWEKMAVMYAKAGCNALELNFCCPFPPKDLVKNPDEAFMGISFTHHPEKGAEVIKRVKELIDIPVFPKLNPDGRGFDEIVKVFEAAGADGVSLFANNRLLRIDIETGRPVNHGPCAGTTQAIKAHSLSWISRIAKASKIPVLGGRGATTWQDGIEFLMGGAHGVEYCVTIMLRGLGYVKVLKEGLESFMERRGYKTIGDFRGIALKHILSDKEMIENIKPLFVEVDMKKCTGCYRCLEVCWYDAIKRLPKKVTGIKDNCVGCTLCSQVCPVRAISIKEREDDRDHFRALVQAHPDLAPEDIL